MRICIRHPRRARPPSTPTTSMRNLYQNMVKLKLDVTQHVPIEGRVGTNDEFLKLLGKTLTSEK